MAPALLLADIGDLIQALVPIGALVIWVITQVMGAAKGKPAAGRPAAPPRPVAPQAQPKPDNLGGEIEEFLRKAAQRREGQPAGQAAPEARPQRNAAEEKRRRQSSQQQRPKNQPKREPAPKPQVTAQRTVARPRQESADVPTLHPSAVDHADEAMQEHVSKVFNHRLGTLASRSDVGEGAVVSAPVDKQPAAELRAAAGLATVLANRENLQTAIILTEIMQRPEHRW